jgi:hypothetical protein
MIRQRFESDVGEDRMTQFRNSLMASAAVVAMIAAISPNASAGTLPYQFTPGGIPGIGTPIPAPFTATDIQGFSDALVQQTSILSGGTQHEVGWDEITSMSNGGTFLTAATTGITTKYNLYITYDATVTGIIGFGAGQSGTITAFTLNVFADPQLDDVFTAGATSATGGTAPSISNTGNDIPLATGSLVAGSAGFASVTGAPFFDVLTTFALTAAGQLVFTQPVPFYHFEFTSTLPSSADNITGGGTNPPNATINSIVSDTSFVPEPASLALLGTALLGFGLARSRRRKQQIGKA